MSSTYIIDGFKEYMKDVNLEESHLEYNLKVVRSFYTNILKPQGKDLDCIDIYAFEEFTDLIDLIDREFNGKSGIVKILDAFLSLTEYLKINKIIKGGKIAYYRRIFTNSDYYIDKYEAIKGKKDGSREFIKKITKNRLSQNIIRILEDVNMNKFNLLKIIEEILDEESDMVEYQDVVEILKSIELLGYKGKKLITTKRGRALLRLEPEERYAAIVYSLLYECCWFESPKMDRKYILKCVSSVNSILQERCSVNSLKFNMAEEGYLVICNNSYRLNRLLNNTKSKVIFDILFLGLGLVNKTDDKEYVLTELGRVILKLISSEIEGYLKYRLDKINKLIKNKGYNNLEGEIIDFILIFGESSTMIDYLGQILILKGKYKDAYKVLSYGYERADTGSSRAKKILTHLILCCRKLEFKGEEGSYSKKLKRIDK